MLNATKNVLTVSGMSESERSSLVYLLDALDVSPQKSEKLIKIIDRNDASESFRKIIHWLRNSLNISKTAVELREHLR